MARKKQRDLVMAAVNGISGGGTPPAMLAAREKAAGYAKTFEEVYSHRFTPEEIERQAINIAMGGEFEFLGAKGEDPDATSFANVEGKADTVADEPSYMEQRLAELGQQKDELGNYIDAVQAGAERSAAGAIRMLDDAGNTAGVTALFGKEAKDRLVNSMVGDLNKAALANDEAIKPFREVLKQRGGAEQWLGEGFLDVAGSPSSAASIIGGPAGAIAIADAYGQSYNSALEKGLPDDEARIYAATQAAPELISLVPAGKVLEEMPVIGPLLKKKVKEVGAGLIARVANPSLQQAAVVAKTALGEAGEEGTTSGIQDLVLQVQAGMATGKLQKLAEEERAKTPEEFASKVGQGARSGFLMGGPGGFIEGTKVANEAQKQINANTGVTEGKAVDDALQLRDLAESNNQPVTTPDPNANFTDVSGTPAEPVDTYTPEQRKADEEEAGFRTIERQKAQPLVDKFGGPPIKPVTPEEVRTEREAEEKRSAELDAALAKQVQADKQAAEDKADAEALAATQAQAKKEREAAEAKKKEEDAKALEGRRATVMRELIDANPEADPKDLIPELRRRMAQPVSPTEAKVATAITRADGTAKGVETRKTNAAIAAKTAAYRKANPNATKEEIAAHIDGSAPAPVAAPTVAPAPKAAAVAAPAKPTGQPKADKDMTTADTESLLDDLDDLKQEGGSTVPTDPVERKEFTDRVRETVRDLGRRNTRQSDSIQNLIRQGKIKFASTPQSIGRKPSNAQAAYDINSGQMYVYTHQPNGSKNSVAHIAAALHEATHGGQFNDRDGRSDIYSNMMSQDGNSKASNAIRKAAEGGNRLAKEAVRRAQAAHPKQKIKDLELVPYFVTEAVEARATTFGQLGGVVKDVKSGARNMLRKAGLDLDLSLDDINSAAQLVGEEIVNTDIKGTDARGTKPPSELEMVVGRTGSSYQKKVSDGKTYRGRVDGQPRYVISDRDSTVTKKKAVPESILRGEEANLSDVLDHPSLYKEYPWLKDAVKVKTDPDMMKGYHGLWNMNTDGVGGTLTLPVDTVERWRDNDLTPKEQAELRKTVLHEVQHAIQAKEGMAMGDNAERHKSRKVRERYEQAEQMLNDAVRKFEFGRAMQTLPPAIRQEAAGLSAEKFLREGLNESSTDRNIVNYSRLKYGPARNEYNEARQALIADIAKAESLYARSHGEAEARTVEQTSYMTQEELDSMPFEERFGKTPYLLGNPSMDVKIEDTIDTGGIRSAFKEEVGELEQTSAPDTEPALDKNGLPPSLSRSPKNKLGFLRGLWDNAQGAGPVAQEITEFAKTAPTDAVMKAEAIVGQYDTALARMAYKLGTTPEQLNKQIGEELDALPQDTDGIDANRAAFNSVADKYGKAGEAMKELRDIVDSLTFDLIRQRKASGGALSDTEKKLYRTMVNNAGRYTHRQYAAGVGKVGNVYSKQVWKDYEKGKAGGKMSEAEQDNYNRVAYATKWLVDNALAIPDDAAIAELPTEQVDKLFRTWAPSGAVEGKTDEAKRQFLADTRDAIGPEVLDVMAETTAKELLGLLPSENATTTQYKGGQRDNSIIKQRSRIPVELRNLMGEITDPSTRLLMTVAKQAEFTARTKMLLEMRDGMPGHVAPNIAKGTEAAKGMTELRGEAWGPMEGYLVTPQLRALMGDTIQQIATFEQTVAMATANPQGPVVKGLEYAAQKWSGVAGFSKMMQIVWSPVNYAWNYVGAWRMLVNHGNLNPLNAAKAHLTSAKLIAYALNPSTADADVRDVNKYGVTDSATIGSIGHAKYERFKEVVEKMAKGEPGLIGGWGMTAMKDLKAAGLTARETYAYMDVWVKMANYYQQVDVLTDFYKKNGGKNEAGREMTEEAIKREAADSTNRTNITYKRAAPLIKGVERTGLSNFATYFYETFRSEIGNVFEGGREIDRALNGRADGSLTPAASNEMLLRGTKRLTGQAVAWGMTAKLSAAAAMMTFGGDDDEERKKRALLPDYIADTDFLQVGTKDGKPVYANVSRLDPVGPLTDIMRKGMNGDTSGDAMAMQLLDFYVAPRLVAQAYKALGASLGSKDKITRDPLLRQMNPEAYKKLQDMLPFENRTTKAWTNVLEAFFPGWATSLRDTNVHPDMKDGTSTGAAVASYSGMTLYQMNPKDNIKFANYAYSDATKDAKARLAELFDNGQMTDADDVLGHVADYRKDEKKAFDKLKDVYDGGQLIGVPKREMIGYLKDNRVPKETIAQLVSGNFQSTLISKSTFDNAAKKAIAKADTPAEKKEAKKHWADAWETMQMVQDAADDQESEE